LVPLLGDSVCSAADRAGNVPRASEAEIATNKAVNRSSTCNGSCEAPLPVDWRAHANELKEIARNEHLTFS
jgi:hypothetical protein